MADYRKHEIITGLFVVAAVIVFSIFAFRVGDADLFGLFRPRSITCRSYFDDVGSLADGAQVKVGGRSVGKVIGVRIVERELEPAEVERLVRLHEDKVERGVVAGMLRQAIEVRFEVNDPDLKIDVAGARVSLAQDSPLTPHFLELDPGEWAPDASPRPLVESAPAEPPVIRTREAVGLEDLISAARPVIGKLDAILSKIDRRVLDDKNVESLGRFVTDVSNAAASIKGAAADLESVLDARGAAVTALTGILEDVKGVTGELEPRIERLQRDLQAALADTRNLVRDAGDILKDNRAEIAELARRLRRAAWHAEMAMRKVSANPAVVFWGDDDPDLEAAATDETWLRATGRAPPYGQRDEAARGR